MGQSERLTEQFKDSTNLNKLLDGLTDPYDELEQAAIDIREKTRLDTAEGEQAKLNGRKVGINLTGFADVIMRALANTKILSNRAFGAADAQMQIASELGEHLAVDPQTGPIPVSYLESLPSKHVIDISDATGVTIEERFKSFYSNLVCGAKTGGTKCGIFHGGTAAGPGTFIFDSSTRGFDLGQLGEIF